MEEQVALVRVETIEAFICLLRGERVLLDQDIARLYGVETKALVRAMKRNLERFPEDFMFQLTEEEVTSLRYQFGTSSWGGRRYRPYAFTEQGVAMLSSVLRSEQAVQVNIEIMRTFVRLRRMAGSREDLARKIEALEDRYDAQFRVVFDALRELMAAPNPRSGRSDSSDSYAYLFPHSGQKRGLPSASWPQESQLFFC